MGSKISMIAAGVVGLVLIGLVTTIVVLFKANQSLNRDLGVAEEKYKIVESEYENCTSDSHTKDMMCHADKKALRAKIEGWEKAERERQGKHDSLEKDLADALERAQTLQMQMKQMELPTEAPLSSTPMKETISYEDAKYLTSLVPVVWLIRLQGYNVPKAD